MHARRIFIDVYLTSFLSLALAGFVMALRFPARRRRWLMFMYVALGLGILTKGPVALALPGLACGLWLVVERRVGDLRRMMLLPGLAIIAAIVLPWYVAVYLRHGWPYITQFVFGENLERYATAMTPDGRDALFYIPVLLTDLFPWSLLILVPLATGWKGRGAGEDATHASIRRLLWFWIVTVVGFFSLSQTKEDLYIFPVAAATAALIADLLAADAVVRRRFVSACFLSSAAACVGIAIGIASLFRVGFYRIDAALFIASVVGLTGAAAVVLWITGRRRPAVMTLAAGFVVFNLLFVGRVLPDVERFKPVPALVHTLETRATPGAALASYSMSLPSLTFYLSRPVPELGSIDEVFAFIGGPTEAWLVTNDETWDAIRRRVPSACVADRHALFAFDSAKIMDIVHGTPPPDAFLVANRCGVRGSAAATGPGRFAAASGSATSSRATPGSARRAGPAPD